LTRQGNSTSGVAPPVLAWPDSLHHAVQRRAGQHSFRVENAGVLKSNRTRVDRDFPFRSERHFSRELHIVHAIKRLLGRVKGRSHWQETHALGSCAKEDRRCAEGAMGKGKGGEENGLGTISGHHQTAAKADEARRASISREVSP